QSRIDNSTNQPEKAAATTGFAADSEMPHSKDERRHPRFGLLAAVVAGAAATAGFTAAAVQQNNSKKTSARAQQQRRNRELVPKQLQKRDEFDVVIDVPGNATLRAQDLSAAKRVLVVCQGVVSLESNHLRASNLRKLVIIADRVAGGSLDVSGEKGADAPQDIAPGTPPVPEINPQTGSGSTGCRGDRGKLGKAGADGGHGADVCIIAREIADDFVVISKGGDGGRGGPGGRGGNGGT
ncbi:unnamed protein product, partial [Durusdinium trenchii]